MRRIKTRRNRGGRGGGLVADIGSMVNDSFGGLMSRYVNPMVQRAIEINLCKCDQKTLDMIGPRVQIVKQQIRQILDDFAGKINERSVGLILNIVKAVPFLGIIVVGIEELFTLGLTAENAREVYQKIMGYVNQVSQSVYNLKQQTRFPVKTGGKKHEQILERTIQSIQDFDETTYHPLKIHIRSNTKKNRK